MPNLKLSHAQNFGILTTSVDIKSVNCDQL